MAGINTQLDFEHRLLDLINKEIVGARVKQGEHEKRYSETGEDYVEFGCMFKKWQFPIVLYSFKRVLRGYKDSVELVFSGRLRDINSNGGLKVYWRHKPEVRFRNKAREDALNKAIDTFRGDLSKEQERIKKYYINVREDDCTFYTRFLFTYNETL